jgi:hypothetical protein
VQQVEVLSMGSDGEPKTEGVPNIKEIKRYSCPICGSTEKFMEGMADKEREKGNISADMPAPLEMKQQTIANPNMTLITGMMCPTGVAFFDVCKKCGTFYCYMTTETVGVLGLPQSQGPMPKGHRITLGPPGPPG